jgi:hypothetical protein
MLMFIMMIVRNCSSIQYIPTEMYQGTISDEKITSLYNQTVYLNALRSWLDVLDKLGYLDD